jgi:hypothetical protein
MRRALYPLLEREFTYAEYDAFLGRLAAAPVRVVPVAELDEAPAEATGVLALRHDVDERLDSALRLAQLEHDHGLRATYYVLHTARYWEDEGLIASLQRLHSLGHEVGWHNDLVTMWITTGSDPRAYLTGELARLREAGIAVTGVASHGAALCYRLGYHNNAFFSDFDDEERPAFPNSDSVDTERGRLPIPKGRLADFGLEYEAYHLDYDLYYSDTYVGTSRWHPAELNLGEVGAGHKAVVLIHPCHWDEGVVAKVRRFGRDLAAGKWRGS